MRIQSVPLNQIICESNRKYTKDEGFPQLKNSIKQYGIIQMPSLREMDEDQFKTVAGRRRIEAARQLGMTCVDCMVREEDDPLEIDEEIALTENVNRQEMHPLDEAGAFKRMFEAGSPIEEIARYYARSPNAIYKRLRLSGLVEELKMFFRDGRINISGAAVLAELPDEDQFEFFETYKENTGDLNNFIITFFNKKQRYVIMKRMTECEGCNKRTHNDGNELFDDYDLADVCLNADCYRVKWYEMITSKLSEQKLQFEEAGVNTDNKIFFNSGVPALLYKKAAYVNIGQDQKYEILRTKDYEFTEETNRKKDTCWEIVSTSDGQIIIHRIGYKLKPPREKEGKINTSIEKYNFNALNGGADIKKYGREAIEAVAKERGETPAELTKNLYDKKIYHFNFTSDIDEIVSKKIIHKRIELEKKGIEPPRDYLSMFLLLAEKEGYFHSTFKEKDFNDEQKQWYKDLLGNKSIVKISDGLNEEAQKLFHFLILCIGFIAGLPALENIKNINNDDNIFWKYAAITKDEYRAMYLEAAREVAAKALTKKESKKKAVSPNEEIAKEAGSPSLSNKKKKTKQEEIEEEDNYPFEPDHDPDIDIDEEDYK